MLRVELDKKKYQVQRTGKQDPEFPVLTTDTIYVSVQEQLDMQYWDAVMELQHGKIMLQQSFQISKTIIDS